MNFTEEDELAVELNESLLNLGLPLSRNIQEEISRRIGSKYKSAVHQLTKPDQLNSMRILFKVFTQKVIDFYNKTVAEAGATPEHFKYYESHKIPLYEIFTEKDAPLLATKIKKFFKGSEVEGIFNSLRPYLEHVRLFRERGIRSTQELVNPFLLYDIHHEIEDDYGVLLGLLEQERASSAALLAGVNAEVERGLSAKGSRAPTPGFLPRAPSRASTASAPASRVGSRAAHNADYGTALPSPTPFFRSASNAAAARLERLARNAGGAGNNEEGEMTPGMSPMPGNGSPFSPAVVLEEDLVPLQRLNYEFGGGGGRRRGRSTRRQRAAGGKPAPFYPPKYFRGLSKRAKTQRKKEIQKYGAIHWKNPAAYVGFQTDRGVRTRPSSYTEQWNALFPQAKSLKERAAVTGVPLREIEESYNRGMAAWRTGHRPGATQQQWGYARVSSFLLCGKTHFTTDSDLVRRAKQRSAAARSWWKKQCPSD
jgi:hypothetical protein